MSWIITGTQKLDPDAQAYIGRVEQADQANLEPAVKDAINAFVVGCKADGIWNAIRTGCVLAGARTVAGALVPLTGHAPANFGFAAGDYDRKTGLIGGGSQYLNSNVTAQAMPQNSFHAAVYVSSSTTSGTQVYMGSSSGSGALTISISNNQIGFRNNSNTPYLGGSSSQTGLLGSSRSAAASYEVRFGGATNTTNTTSQSPASLDIFVFRQNSAPQSNYTTGRLAFYSIGESLDLAKLDTRVTDLITALAAAIP